MIQVEKEEGQGQGQARAPGYVIETTTTTAIMGKGRWSPSSPLLSSSISIRGALANKQSGS